ncbi:MAG: dienelactone hydrolase family protein [Elusimicrobiota bacterium]
MPPSLYALLPLLLAVSSHAAIKTEVVEYKHDDKVLQGYFAYDDQVKGKRPAVFIVHEWYGHGPYARRRAEQLAKLGYLAFAGDMYGKGVFAKNHEEAGKLAGGVKGDYTLWLSRGLAGLAAMKNHPKADPDKLAAMGYCFGGGTVLALARAGVDLKGVVSFHGSLDTTHPAGPGGVKAKILVLHGADDGFVNAAVPAFQDEMRKAKADWQLVSYGGAVHSFTVKEAGDDPSKGMAYDEAADRRSWQAMKDFFAEIFR